MMGFYLKNTLVLASTWYCLLLQAQETYTKIDSLEFSADVRLLRVDYLANVYAVDTRNTITLLKTNGQYYRYNEKSLGALLELDVSNPMKILAHYAESNVVLLLDNTLQVIANISLESYGVYGMGVRVATSKMGGMWLFDPIQHQITRYRFDGSKNTGVQLPRNQGTLQVAGLTEQDSRLLMGLTDGRVLIFDINGTYLDGLPSGTAGYGVFQIWAGKLYAIGKDGLHIWSLNENIGQKLPLPGSNRNKDRTTIYFCQLGRIYAWRSNRLVVFRINDV